MMQCRYPDWLQVTVAECSKGNAWERIMQPWVCLICNISLWLWLSSMQISKEESCALWPWWVMFLIPGWDMLGTFLSWHWFFYLMCSSPNVHTWLLRSLFSGLCLSTAFSMKPFLTTLSKITLAFIHSLTCSSSLLYLYSTYCVHVCMLSHFSSVWLFVTRWTVAC